jgi:O-antigen ligase
MGAKIGYFYPTIRAFLFIPFVIGLRATGNQLLVSRGFFLGGSAGGLAAAFFSGYSLLMHPGVRVGAPISNPIPFAQIATILALTAFASIFNSGRHWEKILSVLGFLGAIFTIYASGSYGPLLGCCCGLLVIVAFLFGRRPSKLVLLGVGILLVAFVLILMPLLAGKFHQIVSEFSAYFAGSGMGTSQGQRLIAWSISLREIVHAPFLGIGPGHFDVVLERFCAANPCSSNFRGFHHVHSQYFETALNSGLIGLLGLLVSLASPAVLFFRRIGLSRAVSRDASIVGLAVVVAAMTSMVSQPLYAHNISTISYFLTISVCWFLAYPSARQG